MPDLPSQAEPLLLATGVQKVYRTGAVEVEALAELDLSVGKGELVAVMGASGSGKTTLLNCLSGLDDIDSGTVLVEGHDLFAMRDAARTEHRAKAMGFIFQSFNLIPVFSFYEPGDTFVVTDPQSGVSRTKTIVGILRNATVFYSPSSPTSFPVIASSAAVLTQFGPQAQRTSAFVKAAGPTTPESLAVRMQGDLLPAGLVATPIARTIRRLFDANLAFFRLMQGFLALGLLIGIAGLGVVMVRAVRERRRTIGILRALGLRAQAVERAFLLESGFIALQGVLLGAGLGLLTTWLRYQRSGAFSGMHTGFPVEWRTMSLMALGTVAASLLATLSPARRAAHVLPAVATRAAT